MFAWDEPKRLLNRAKHGVDFAEINLFDWASAVTRVDTRAAYGEQRFISVGPIADRLHVCVWTLRDGRNRVISLRKANSREGELYVQAQKLH